MNTPSRKKALLKHRHTPSYAAAQKRWLSTPEGRASRRAIEQRYRAANREKINAKRAVAHAVKKGRLPRARKMPCFRCLGDAQCYHHPSYKRAHRLRVVPLCHPCHVAVHQELNTEAKA